jgi:uncharacterized damage-inducible protein DinB
MELGITFEELLAWNDDAAEFWNTHLTANPALLELPCGIGGAANMQDLVAHIWVVELRWGQRLAGLPAIKKEEAPTGPLPALFDLHVKGIDLLRGVLAAPAATWDEPYILTFDWVPPEHRNVSRRKVFAHALFHSQRHWAQLATLVRAAGFPSGFRGDLLFSPAMR